MGNGTKKRALIVVNKYWECDPVCWVLTNKYIDDQDGKKCGNIDVVGKSGGAQCLAYPAYGPVKAEGGAEKTQPRIVYETDERTVEVWCISDLLAHSPGELQSSSEEKMKLLPILYRYGGAREIELVAAVGTASSGPGEECNPLFGTDNINGSVVIGGRVFMHDGGDKNSKSHYQSDDFGKIMSTSDNPLLETLADVDWAQYGPLLLRPPVNPADRQKQRVYVDKEYVALGDVNVTDYTKYSEKDRDTGDAFREKYPDQVPYGVSVETTHALIYQAAKDDLNGIAPPFLFISGVVDRFTKFSEDVDPQVYAQNVSGAHNAGVAVAYILSLLNGGKA